MSINTARILLLLICSWIIIVEQCSGWVFIERSLTSMSFRWRNAHRGPAARENSKSRLASKSDTETQHQREESRPPLAWTIPKGIKFGRLDRLELLPMDHDTDQKENLLSKDEPKTATIATRAIGLNFADIFTVLGLYSAANLVRGKSLSSFIPGLEFAGQILEDPTATYERGDRVLGFTRFGSYAEVVSVPPVFLIPLPDSWSFAQGAGFLVQALTAWHGLVEIGRMPNLKHKSKNNNKSKNPYVVIVHSASGGVGLWASELVARRGGIVLGIVGDESKQKVFHDRIVSELSPESRVMIRGKEKDFSQRLARELWSLHSNNNDSQETVPSLNELAKIGCGADMVMESLGGKYFRASFDALNDGGALVTFGSTTYSSPGRGGINLFRLVWRYLNRPRIDPGDLTARNLRLCGFNLIFLTEQTAQLQRELSDCVSCLSGNEETTTSHDTEIPLSLENVIPPTIGATFDFQTQAIDAMERLKSGSTVGKVVLVNEDVEINIY